MPASPAQAEHLAAGVVVHYQDAEAALTARIARNLSRGIDAPEWAATKLAQMQEYERQARRLLADLEKKAASGVATAITEAYDRGGLSAVADIAKVPGFHDLTVEITRDIEHADQAFLGLIKTPKELRGQGLARQALKEVTDLADRNSVTTRLLVIPGQHPGDELSTKELKAWYARNGFIQDARDPDLMVRYPENPYKGKAPPKTNYAAFEKGVAELSSRSAVAAEPLAGLRAIEALTAETLGNVVATHPAILRSVTDAYRSIIAESAPGVLLGDQTRRQAAQAALNRFAAAGIKGFTDKAGRAWSMESYTEMAMRTGCGRAAVQGHVDRLTANGLDLVIVSDAPKECPLCRPWEGKVLSIGGAIEMPEDMDPAFQVESDAAWDKEREDLASMETEQAVMRTSTGEILRGEMGTETGAELSAAMRAQAEGATLLHNHPGWTRSFSPQDVVMAAHNRLAAIEVVTPDRTLFRAIPGVRGWPPEDVVKKTWASVLERETSALDRIKGLSDVEWEKRLVALKRELNHTAMTQLHKDGWTVYTRAAVEVPGIEASPVGVEAVDRRALTVAQSIFKGREQRIVGVDHKGTAAVYHPDTRRINVQSGKYIARLADESSDPVVVRQAVSEGHTILHETIHGTGTGFATQAEWEFYGTRIGRVLEEGLNESLTRRTLPEFMRSMFPMLDEATLNAGRVGSYDEYVSAIDSIADYTATFGRRTAGEFVEELANGTVPMGRVGRMAEMILADAGMPADLKGPLSDLITNEIKKVAKAKRGSAPRDIGAAIREAIEATRKELGAKP